MPISPQSPVLAAQASTTNQPKARGYAPEVQPTPAPKPRPIQLPTPAELGLANPVPAATSSVDWNQTHARLQQLGALGFHLDRLPDGSTRVTLLLPARQAGRSQQVECLAVSDAAAVAAALERAEDFARSR